MGLYFASCRREDALRFIQHYHPEVEDTPESVGPLLDLVAKDIVRVTDPKMHRACELIPGTHWDEARRDEVVAACAPLAKGGAS